MKKKIAIVSNLSWNLYNFRLSLMNAMRDAGYEVIAIAPYDKYSQKIIDAGFEFHDIKMNAQGINPIEDIKTTYAFYKLFKRISPDVLCQYTIKPNIYGSFVANILNIKMINNIAGLGTLFIKDGLITKIAKILYKVSQSKADRVFFQNRDDFNFFTNKGIVSAQKCDILPGSGVDTNRFRPQYKEESEKIRFLLIARMIWEKGIAEYVEAAREIKKIYPNVEFCLLGFLDVENPGAITRNEMNHWVEEGVINYLGVSDKVDEVIQSADCVVLPSYYREGTPKTLLESGSCGKPIITTDNVGCRDVVDHGVNGFICEPRSSDDLKLKVEMFLALTHKERVEMGRKSREKMKREFDEKLVINKYLDLLTQQQQDQSQKPVFLSQRLSKA
ncbi:MAG: Lipid carrier : UDP-N-acetylgalactosaminyltransferase (EC / Alpha-1,3-N-acetylgalactosamine transferase PglA (EC; Putative glycosyltransferase [uncultured Sulfurovum sp.]|uniref:Lipid carrier: UDP-N-acetylgalactosaminyltransferase ) n=1 Tax=uncultured Sulfurovum sp. TaxID=269237 RepID=A0A6S6TGN8_9BACT|nr:MAG: Lipid carrier : UDP-N-acetylgalactosaminyltransferase (EC / Alpha-1,3-N-acetylgalactosamine transferase PglA (EC; Putative glycosyltransferase [uncultured Sulfurovum sp.]